MAVHRSVVAVAGEVNPRRRAVAVRRVVPDVVDAVVLRDKTCRNIRPRSNRR